MRIRARCQNPHTKLRGVCNTLNVAEGTNGEFSVECPRCHGLVPFSFETEGTLSQVGEGETHSFIKLYPPMKIVDKGIMP